MDARHSVPNTVRHEPRMSGQRRRRVYVIKNPVAVPEAEDTAEQVTRRRPDVVALVRRTPWKNRGLKGRGLAIMQREEGVGAATYTLKMTELATMDAKKLEKMRFICGDFR